MKGLRMSAGLAAVVTGLGMGLFFLAMLLAGFFGVERSAAERLGFRMSGLFGVLLSPFWVATGISWARQAAGRGR